MIVRASYHLKADQNTLHINQQFDCWIFSGNSAFLSPRFSAFQPLQTANRLVMVRFADTFARAWAEL